MFHVPLDTLDQQIVSLLIADGRRTLADIGREVGLSTPAVKRRVDQLEHAGTIRGYTAIVDQAALGWGLEAIIELRLEGNSPPHEAARSLRETPEIISAFTVAGDFDLITRIRVRDTPHLQDTINRLRRRPEVRSTRTTVIMEAVIDRPPTPLP
jgi:Lrp/AsnC family transcriptional regulator, leucine-responsive regulatory protein